MEGQNASDSQKNRRYVRHSIRQTRLLEFVFRECRNPTEKQRAQLGRELGLDPRQIKFWFQNRRTLYKAQFEKADNYALKIENEEIRSENDALCKALSDARCISCRVPGTENTSSNLQKLRLENFQLKEEIGRITMFVSSFRESPVTEPPSAGFTPTTLLNLSLGPFSATRSSKLPELFPTFSKEDKLVLTEMASNALDEVVSLCQMDGPMWIESRNNDPDILHYETYDKMFPRWSYNSSNTELHKNGSRYTEFIQIYPELLIDMLISSTTRMELFPNIISKAKVVQILDQGSRGDSHGYLALMYEELQVLSPLVPAQGFYFLRHIKETKEGWAIADTSVGFSQANQFKPMLLPRILPSGCFIEDMPGDYVKVTWLVHIEMNDKTPIHPLYRGFINSGAAFGAKRWLATLSRGIERYDKYIMSGLDDDDVDDDNDGEYTIWLQGKGNITKLSQKMVNKFCANLNASNEQGWTNISGSSDVEVRVSVHKSEDSDPPKAVVLNAATSIWLPVSSETVFNFFMDKTMRSKWDVLSNGNSAHEISQIALSSGEGNFISLLRALNSGENNFILQESCSDASGSMLIYAAVELPDHDISRRYLNLSSIPLLPSGFVITPAKKPSTAPASSDATGTGSLIAISFQMLLSCRYEKVALQSTAPISNLISTTVKNIKEALNCSDVLPAVP